jgi:hypothetical protein
LGSAEIKLIGRAPLPLDRARRRLDLMNERPGESKHSSGPTAVAKSAASSLVTGGKMRSRNDW